MSLPTRLSFSFSSLPVGILSLCMSYMASLRDWTAMATTCRRARYVSLQPASRCFDVNICWPLTTDGTRTLLKHQTTLTSTMTLCFNVIRHHPLSDALLLEIAQRVPLHVRRVVLNVTAGHLPISRASSHYAFSSLHVLQPPSPEAVTATTSTQVAAIDHLRLCGAICMWSALRRWPTLKSLTIDQLDHDLLEQCPEYGIATGSQSFTHAALTHLDLTTAGLRGQHDMRNLCKLTLPSLQSLCLGIARNSSCPLRYLSSFSTLQYLQIEHPHDAKRIEVPALPALVRFRSISMIPRTSFFNARITYARLLARMLVMVPALREVESALGNTIRVRSPAGLANAIDDVIKVRTT